MGVGKYVFKVVLVLLHWSAGLIVKLTSPLFAWKYENQKGKTPRLEEGLTLTQAQIVTTPAVKLAHKIRKREVRIFLSRVITLKAVATKYF